MIKTSVRRSRPRFNATRTVDTIVRYVLDALAVVAEGVVTHNAASIRAEQSPSGAGPQKENEPATQRQKIREYGTSTSLEAEGVLADASRYRITRGKFLVGILPPEEREEVITYLRNAGYDVFRLPPDIRTRVHDAVTRALKTASRDLST